MAHGERDAEPEILWLRIARSSLSARVTRTVLGFALVAASAIALWLTLVPRAEREQLVVGFAFDFLSQNPPSDLILAQLPPERLESVRARLTAFVARMLLPGAVSAGTLLLLVAAAYGLIARRLRFLLGTVQCVRPSEPAPPERASVFFWSVTIVALCAHLPHALESIRFDEDGAAIYASSGWFAWANNLAGWQNHVAALLTIRLSTALFGMNELAVRAPAIIASSFALAFLCSYLRRRFSTWTAVLTAALFVALPLWAEQTALARGYGLTFSAAALLVVGLLQLDEEGYQPSTRTMFCLFAGSLIGPLAHVFFAFLTIGLFVLAATTKRLSTTLRPAMLWWLILAGTVPAVSALIGLPGMLVLLSDPGTTAIGDILRRFTDELSFRHEGVTGALLIAAGLLCFGGSIVALPARVRTPLLVLMGFAILGPLLGNPAYIYPRYFLHVAAFAVPCAAWFISDRILRRSQWANAACLLAIVGLWASTRPWDLPMFVDLRGAAEIARAESQVHRDRFAVDTFLSCGVRFYNGDPGRIVNSAHPIPEDVERFLTLVHHVDGNAPSGFAIERRLPGSECDIVLVSKLH